MGLRLVVAASSFALVLAGCGSSHAVRLSVKIVSGFGAQARHQHFTLRCNPTGGDMPNRITLCRMIAAHPKAMLHPDQPRSGCTGGVGMPQVTVTGSAVSREVSLSGSPMCDWPGGVSALAYWAAAEAGQSSAETKHLLRVASVRLRCDEDAALLKRPTPWARVRACLAAQPAAAASKPVTGKEWHSVVNDWFVHGRFAEGHTCAAVVVARSRVVPACHEGMPLVHALDVYERRLCPAGDVWAVRIGMSDREVASTAGAPIPWRSGPHCWLYHASKAGTPIDRLRVCFKAGRVAAIQYGIHG
jgi:hypothetical protein